MLTPQELADFEEEMAQLYSTGTIPYPIHLRGSEDLAYEENLVRIFTNCNISEKDYVLGFWDSHALALLKGVPREELKEAIIRGESIALNFPKHRVFCSGIVGSLLGVAVGIAYSCKQRNQGERVFIYCGDMSSYCGIFYEAIQYAGGHYLPCYFIVGDNGVSVMTDTYDVWNTYQIWQGITTPNIITFNYKNKYNHSGLKQRISF